MKTAGRYHPLPKVLALEGSTVPALIVLSFVMLLGGCGKTVGKGIEAYEKKDYAEARAIFLANQENPQALLYLHEMHKYGFGGPVNTEEARKYAMASAAKGFAPAHILVAKNIIAGDQGYGDDKTAALVHLEAAERLGDPGAAHELGNYYADEKAGNDPKRAMEFYERGKGTVAGNYQLAFLHEYGLKGAKYSPSSAFSYAEAMTKMKPGANERSMVSLRQFDLAEYYLYGFGIQRDHVKARDILERLALQNRDWKEPAEALLAWMAFHGNGVSADQRSAVETWERQVEGAMKGEKSEVSPYTRRGLRLAYRSNIGGPFSGAVRAAVERGSIRDAYLQGPDELFRQLDEESKCEIGVGELNAVGRYRVLAAAIHLQRAECAENGTPRNLASAYFSARKAIEFDPEMGTARAKQLLGKMSPAEKAQLEKLAILLGVATTAE